MHSWISRVLILAVLLALFAPAASQPASAAQAQRLVVFESFYNPG